MNKKTIVLASFLALVGGVSAGLIATVNQITQPIIESKLVEEKVSSLKEFFPQLTNFEEFSIEEPSSETLKAYYTILVEEQVVGYVFESRVLGYGGDIQALISYDIQTDTLMDIAYIGAFNETPGFGTRVFDPEFTTQVKEQAVSTIEIDTLAGATVTSSAVKQMIDEANAFYLNLNN